MVEIAVIFGAYMFFSVSLFIGVGLAGGTIINHFMEIADAKKEALRVGAWGEVFRPEDFVLSGFGGVRADVLRGFYLQGIAEKGHEMGERNQKDSLVDIYAFYKGGDAEAVSVYERAHAEAYSLVSSSALASSTI